MPRAAGQIDQRKSEAILDAAAEALAERGLAASMEDIARRAGVSKQTLYNRYRGKEELAQALAARRVEELTAALTGHADEPQVALETLALSLLHKAESKGSILRFLIKAAGEPSDLTRQIYEAGPRQTKARLAAFFAEATALGTLDVPEPEEAAELFLGMVTGHGSIRSLLGAGAVVEAGTRERRAREVALRFVRAYARAAGEG